MATAMFTFFFPFFFFFIDPPFMDKVDLPRVYNIIDTVEWQGCERDRKRSDYRKRPILDEPAAPLLIIPRYIVAPHCNNVWCIHKERTPTQRAQRLHHQATSACRVCFLVHTRAGGRAVARGVCIPLKSVERTDSGCRSHDGKRGKERKSYMHVRRTWSPCDRLTGVKVLLMAYPIHAERGI